MIKIVLALIITMVFYIRGRVSFKFKSIFHPLLLTPLFGLFFGQEGFITGITIGVVVELIWGSNLLSYELGLKYILLLSLLTLSLVILTGNISLFFNLALTVIFVFALQESFGCLEENRYFILIIFIFNLIMLLSSPLIKELLGLIPAQFLNDLAISGGALIPIVGLSFLLIQAIKPSLSRDNLWYYSYAIAAIVVSSLLFNSFYWALALFPILWNALYYVCELFEISSKYLRILLLILVIIMSPLIVEWNIPFLVERAPYFLWIEVSLVLFSILRVFKLTAIEGYFIMSLIGIISAKLGLLI